MNDIIYREATLLDVHRITEMWAQLIKGLPLPFMKADEEGQKRFFGNLIWRISQVDNRVLVAVDNGQIIGFLTGHVYTKSVGMVNKIGCGDNLYVDPDYRNGRIALKLINEFIVWAKTHEVKTLELLTVYDDKIVKAWSRRGYTPTQVIHMMEV